MGKDVTKNLDIINYKEEVKFFTLLHKPNYLVWFCSIHISNQGMLGNNSNLCGILNLKKRYKKVKIII